MKKTITGLLLLAFGLLLLPGISSACFDTYLFLQKRGMNYPYQMAAFDGNGEYVIGDLKSGNEDLFSGNFNVYYGLTERFSFQVSASSAEKVRSQFELDELGLRGVYSFICQYRGVYNLDFILEHHTGVSDGSKVYEFSAPSIWYKNNTTFVVHPVAAFGPDMKMGLRGHGGIFQSIGSGSLIGVGAEYASAQSSASLGHRLVVGEAATSLFFGSSIGSSFYLQNELIKGWGAEGPDVGFAMTLKFVVPNFTR